MALKTIFSVITISVVINNYNYARFICEAIDSVFAQSRPAHEIIVVDDGSTDDSVAVLRSRYGNSIKLIESPNQGQLNAIRLGVRAACGDYVACLDADDRWLANHLELVTKRLQTADIDFLIGSNVLIGVASHSPPARDVTSDTDYGRTTLVVLTNEWIGAPTSCLVIRRTNLLFLEALSDQTIAEWKTRADDVLILGASIAGATKYRLAEPTVEYRIHGANHFYGQTHIQAKAFEYSDKRRRLLSLLNHMFYPGIDALELIRAELPKNRLRKWRNRKRIILAAWRCSAGLLDKLAVTAAVMIQR